MRFIKLCGDNGDDLLVNLYLVTAIVIDPDGGCYLYFDGESRVKVSQSFDEVSEIVFLPLH